VRCIADELADNKICGLRLLECCCMSLLAKWQCSRLHNLQGAAKRPGAGMLLVPSGMDADAKAALAAYARAIGARYSKKWHDGATHVICGATSPAAVPKCALHQLRLQQPLLAYLPAVHCMHNLCSLQGAHAC
jgi:twin BRCT domain